MVDSLLTIIFLCIPNMLIGSSVFYDQQLHAPHPSIGYAEDFIFFINNLDTQTILLWCLFNGTLCIALFTLRKYILLPIIGMAYQIHRMLGALHPDLSPHSPTINIRALAFDMARVASIAHEYYMRHHDTKEALLQAQESVKEISLHQDRIISSTCREIAAQYQSVLSYANYLEEQIEQHSLAKDMRYDFDDVSESGFNLKLLAGALRLLHPQHPHRCTSFHVAQLLQETMLALAASLDRRSMKLTTTEVDTNVIAYSDPVVVTHILWMMLLGTIRYAAHESTLKLRCIYNEETSQAFIGITVSELSPGRLTEKERGAFLERQLEYPCPHMFAETIRIHANVQLSEMLLAPLNGELSITPLSSHACEICLKLPIEAG